MDNKSKRITHDIKTERPDVTRPLPAILRVLPAGFYFSTVACAGLAILLGWQLRQAREARDQARAEEKNLQAESAALQKETEAINAESKKAEDVKRWVAGSEPMQSLVVTLLRSMRPSSTLSEVSLLRDKEDPRKVEFTLQLNSGGPAQLDQSLGKITAELNYRPYFSQQKQEKGGAITYSSTLIKQERAENKSQAANTTALPTAATN